MYGLKHQKEKRSMEHFAGLDVSVNETSVCIVDETGKIVREPRHEKSHCRAGPPIGGDHAPHLG